MDGDGCMEDGGPLTWSGVSEVTYANRTKSNCPDIVFSSVLTHLLWSLWPIQKMYIFKSKFQ